MALKDIWQQDRLDRQAEQVERQQLVAETRVANRAALDQMAIETRETLSPVLPELKAQNEARQLEAQCYQAGLKIEVQERRASVQELLTDINLDRKQTAEALRSSLAEFRAELTAQTEIARTDRQAYVREIRAYVWGDEVVSGVMPETLLNPNLSPKPNPKPSPTASSKPAPIGLDRVNALLEADLDELEEESKASTAPSPIDSQLQKLDDRILAALNSDSGVRLVDLQATLRVSRDDLVKGLQQLVTARQVVARDRTYFRTH